MSIARILLWVLPLFNVALFAALIGGFIVPIPLRDATPEQLASVNFVALLATIVSGIVWGLEFAKGYFLPEKVANPPLLPLLTTFAWMFVIFLVFLGFQQVQQGIQDVDVIFALIMGAFVAMAVIGLIVHFIVKWAYLKSYEIYCRDRLLKLANHEWAEANRSGNPWAAGMASIEESQANWPLKKVEKVTNIVLQMIAARAQISATQEKSLYLGEKLESIIRL